MDFNVNDIFTIIPFLVLVVAALAVVLVDLVLPRQQPRAVLGLIALAALAAAGAHAFNDIGAAEQVAFFGAITLDAFATYLIILFTVGASLAVLTMMAKLPEEGSIRGEAYALLLISTAGGILMAQASDLVTMFVAIECLSIPAYILVALIRTDVRSTEAGLKYFVLGAFASGFLIYGIALLYGWGGTTQFNEMHALLSAGGKEGNYLLTGGMLFLLVGIGFKISLVPFHMWTPDVYEGAPTPITGYAATVIKCAGFAVLLRLLLVVFPAQQFSQLGSGVVGWYPLVISLAILTMTVGNILALVQTDIKRMLAYSSIAHAGYLLMGFVGGEDGAGAILFYLTAYTFMTMGAFALVAYFERQRGFTRLADYAGLGRKSWLAGIGFTIFLLSLAGIPPTAGFFAKFYLFQAAINQGEIPLVVVAVLNSILAAAYYIRPVITIFMQEANPTDIAPTLSVSPALIIVIAACLIGVLSLGVDPSWCLAAVKNSVAPFF